MPIQTSSDQARKQPKGIQHVWVLGPRNLQNELLCLVLRAQAGVSTTIVEEMEKLVTKEQNQQELLLMDTTGMASQRMLQELKNREVSKSCIVGLFNLRHGLGIEQEAMRLGVHGFFYQNEGADQLLKGVKLLFKGEIWLSRDILVEAVINGKNHRAATARDQVGLTAREVEILALVAAGGNNHEIADRLFISENTVKTHLYNVFKKIDVPNRLQAALWAVKHLEVT
jgi:DNA-binding NarL/FixJ family response regulator